MSIERARANRADCTLLRPGIPGVVHPTRTTLARYSKTQQTSTDA